MYFICVTSGGTYRDIRSLTVMLRLIPGLSQSQTDISFEVTLQPSGLVMIHEVIALHTLNISQYCQNISEKFSNDNFITF